jgi:outer membrane protein assembly factor BamB
LFSTKRPFKRSSFLFFIILASFLVTACARVSNVSWPGLSADESHVYVAYGPGVFAYNVETGQQTWVYPPQESRKATLFFYAPPSVQGDRVIIGDYGATDSFWSPQSIISIYGLEKNDSSTPISLWIDSDLAEDKIVAAPLQVGDTTYVATSDNLVLALNADTGEEKWRFETGFSVWSQPTYYEGTLFISSLDRNLYAVDADNGSEQWRAELSGATPAQAVVNPDAGLVYVGTFGGKVHAFDLETGAEQWSVEGQDWIWNGPASADGVLYYADSSGYVYAVDAVTGDSLWQTDVHGMETTLGAVQNPPIMIKGAVQAKPVVVDDVVYIASVGNEETGEGLLVALDARTGAELWQQTTPAPLFSTPVVVGDSIVVALQHETAVIIIYDLETGNLIRNYVPPSG